MSGLIKGIGMVVMVVGLLVGDAAGAGGRRSTGPDPVHILRLSGRAMSGKHVIGFSGTASGRFWGPGNAVYRREVAFGRATYRKGPELSERGTSIVRQLQPDGSSWRTSRISFVNVQTGGRWYEKTDRSWDCRAQGRRFLDPPVAVGFLARPGNTRLTSMDGRRLRIRTRLAGRLAQAFEPGAQVTVRLVLDRATLLPVEETILVRWQGSDSGGDRTRTIDRNITFGNWPHASVPPACRGSG